MAIPKQIANKVLSNLDLAADKIEALAKDGKLDPRVASSLIHDIDSFADKFEVAAYGKENLRGRMAKVLKRDPDEKYMDTFDNPNKVIQSDADESFMHKTPASFNSDAIDNFDADRSSTVSERDEHVVRDLSQWADKTTKQPSWARGPAGKSTRQGTSKPSDKNWAELSPNDSNGICR